MKLYDFGILLVIGIAAAAALLGFFSSKALGDDNPIEEFSEQVIETTTGLDIDLTPNSPEKKMTQEKVEKTKQIKIKETK